MKLLLVGATGLVGRQVLDLALADSRVAAVVAPVRRPLPDHPKLLAPVVSFEHLPEDAPWWRADAVVCTLGTTMREAGSEAGFRRVDRDYPLAIAARAKRHGTPTFVLNSSRGAAASSRFLYTRVKGEVERDLAAMGFRSLTIVRPSLIGGRRQEPRLAEQVASVVLAGLRPILPRGWRINPASTIARALIDAAVTACPGRHVVGSASLT